MGQRLSLDDLLVGINLMRDAAAAAHPIIWGRPSRLSLNAMSVNAIILEAFERAA